MMMSAAPLYVLTGTVSVSSTYVEFGMLSLIAVPSREFFLLLLDLTTLNVFNSSFLWFRLWRIVENDRFELLIVPYLDYNTRSVSFLYRY